MPRGKPAKKQTPVIAREDTWEPVRDSKYYNEKILPQADNFCEKTLCELVQNFPRLDEFFANDADVQAMSAIQKIFHKNLRIFAPILPWDPYRREWLPEDRGDTWFHPPTSLLIQKDSNKVAGRVYDEDVLWPPENFTQDQKTWCKNHNLSF